MARRKGFESQPEELDLGIEYAEASTPARFDPTQHRAFGSAPNMLGGNLEIPAFERIPTEAWTRTDAAVLRRGLYGEHAEYSVKGIALTPEYYEAIIRSQKAFLGSTGAKTRAANRLTHPERQQEKFDKSQTEPLVSKQLRHGQIIPYLQAQEENLATLQEWHRVPGYWRTDEADLRIRATQAWQQTFVGMLSVMKDNYGLSPNEEIDMQQAMAYRLFRGQQNDRMGQWGGYLNLGSEYTRRVRVLFEQSDRKIGRTLARNVVESPAE